MDSLRRRLQTFSAIPEEAWEKFSTFSGVEVREFEKGEIIVRAGDPAEVIFIVHEGWARRYRMIGDGRRQITNFMLRGDVFDLQALSSLKADHFVQAATPLTASVFSSRDFLTLIRRSGDIAASFWWAAVQEESILREQIVRIGRRTAEERIAHLLLELRRRLRAAGSEEESIDLRLTRTDLADTLGLTPVHVSRTMSRLRKEGLISEEKGYIHIENLNTLQKLAGFDANYLHLPMALSGKDDQVPALENGADNAAP
ncbi:transcriptional regulator, Crp-Fnr family protein [Parvularcula bermudensis HTCC2503]|uniref:Transcriptional regulator, Crp-Fnr family protein n=1 Tax=Parvularcula bermudensis (strain ATCC BAA-594 / HTCC2503 / KCTC 12087) TaxID=314260 RepID=E0TEX5_PARBH|nr:Crp/Fnr family transcriptional regulator [Parvularcula bermudensis]ADM10068.1 transcriptional regulator, Crp-Fnr family protein [Parvularcula bermudensis HTCC2503]